jgi:PAS domain S-box-containing protein
VTTRAHRWEWVAFVVALLVLVGVELLGRWSTTLVVETAEGAEQTRSALADLTRVQAILTAAEADRRAFALTGEEASGERVMGARAAASEAQRNLDRLLGSDHVRSDALERLRQLSNDRIAQLEAAVEERRAHGFELEREAEATRRGEQQAATIDAAFRTAAGEQERLLEATKAETRERVARARVMQALGTALSGLILAAAFLRLRREIALRVASETRARENERGLATTLYSIGDGVIATDAEGRVQRMNRVAEELTGTPLDEGLGKPFAEVFRVEHERGGDVADVVTRALEEGSVVELDDHAVLIAKDGTRRPIADSAAPIRDADGRVTGSVLVFRDETRAREAERDLRRTKAFLDSIVETIPHMVFVKDASDLSFVRFNRAGEELLGLKREELLGKTDFAFFPVEQAQAFVEKDRETLRGGSIVVIEEEPLETKGGLRWLSTKKVPILDEEGEPLYLLGISEDITSRREAALKLRDAIDASEAANQELEAFSYSVAHDLRAPLRGIDGFSQALLEDYEAKLDEQGKDYLVRVRRAARRMGELIDDLLSLSRVSRYDFSRETVDLTAIARQVGAEARQQRNPDAELVVHDGLEARADPRLVRILLENLLSNAFKFSARKEGARVEVGDRTDSDGVVYFVKDNGVGFDPSMATKLFAPFQRFHKATDFEGTGIGLATVQRIVNRHAGRIWAESSPGGGATFYFTLETRQATRSDP